MPMFMPTMADLAASRSLARHTAAVRFAVPLLVVAILLTISPRAHASAGLHIDELANQDWLALNFIWPEVTGYDWSVSERDLVIRFPSAIPGAFANGLSADAESWVEFMSLGYDSILIRMKPGIEANVSQPGPREVAAVFSRMDRPKKKTAKAAVPDRADLRFRILEAELLRKSGQLIEARRIMRQEMDRNPTDADVLIQLAGIESALGRTEKAIQLYNRVLALQPDLREIADEKARLFRTQEANPNTDTEISFGTVVQLVEDEDRQEEQTLRARHRISNRWAAMFDAERRELSANSVLRPNGDDAPFDGARHQATLGATHALDAKTELTGVIHLSEGLPGFSAKALERGLFAAADTETTLEIDILKPYWGLIEGIVNDGARSRVHGTHYHPLNDALAFYAETGVNTYRVDGESDVADSVSAGASATYTPVWFPEGMTAAYQIDGEYVLTRKVSTRQDGSTFRPLNVVTREVHTGQLAYRREIVRHVNLSLSLGYSYDRFNAKGPSVATGVSYKPMPGLSAEATASQSITSSRGSDSTVNRFGFLLSWLF